MSKKKHFDPNADPDKTDVINVESELARPKQGLLDRILDTKAPQASAENTQKSQPKPQPPAGDSSNKSDGAKPDHPAADDLFSNLNKAPKSVEKQNSGDEFEDILLGGLTGTDTSKIAEARDDSPHWTQKDHERPTVAPISRTDSQKSSKSGSKQSSNKGASPKPAEASNPKRSPGNRVNPGAASRDQQKLKDSNRSSDKSELSLMGDADSADSSGDNVQAKQSPKPSGEPYSKEQLERHDAPTGEIIMKPKSATSTNKAETSGGSRSFDSGKAGTTNSMRERARQKAEADKKGKKADDATKESTEKALVQKSATAAPFVKDNAVTKTIDTESTSKITKTSKITDDKTSSITNEAQDSLDVAPAPETVTGDGFEPTTPPTFDQKTGSTNPRKSGGFKVSTESVKKSLRPPSRVQARKVRRVVRHIDPWSVLTFSVLFHLTIFSSLLLGAVLMWQVADASGVIENIEDVIQELGSYERYELNGWAVFRSAVAIAGIFTLASTILVVILSVIFNLISDLVGGIRFTVVQEETVRVQRDN